MTNRFRCCGLDVVLCIAALGLAACSSPPSKVQSDADTRILDADPTQGDADTDGGIGQPDFALDIGRTRVDMSVGIENFDSNACELDPSEACILAPGDRRLLRFSVETINLGTADIELGPPNQNPNFSYSSCHDHYHFNGYAAYRLLDGDGEELLIGRKQAFCLVDSEQYLGGVNASPRYSCNNQGLQAGWSDVYTNDLACQFLDVTGLPDGAYTLEIEVNPDLLLDDARTSNNRVQIPVTLGDADLATPSEACTSLPARYLDRLERECDWTFAGEYDCTPGELFGAGCSQNCGKGSCTGDPMVRVCDAATGAPGTGNCSNGAALARNDRNMVCGSACPYANEFLCPDSGRIAVYHASKVHGADYTCEVDVGLGPI